MILQINWFYYISSSFLSHRTSSYHWLSIKNLYHGSSNKYGNNIWYFLFSKICTACIGLKKESSFLSSHDHINQPFVFSSGGCLSQCIGSLPSNDILSQIPIILFWSILYIFEPYLSQTSSGTEVVRRLIWNLLATFLATKTYINHKSDNINIDSRVTTISWFNISYNIYLLIGLIIYLYWLSSGSVNMTGLSDATMPKLRLLELVYLMISVT